MSLSRVVGHCASSFSHGSESRPNRAFACLASLALAVVVADPVLADNVHGAWLSPAADNWPLVPVHAALAPDGRVLTFGSKADGTATGFFIYDVWDPADGLSGGHVTLQNMTASDIFCGNAVILPESGDILISGGGEWTGTEVNDTGNNNSNVYSVDHQTLTRGTDMFRARWYATALPLMNGEVYIQGGKHGEDFPEVRERNGGYRLLSNVSTSQYYWYYPRNFITHDGRVFGYDSNGLMYYVTTDGTGTLSPAGQLDISMVGRTSTVAMYRPGKILQVSGKSNKAITIDINGAAPVVAPTGSLSSRRAWATATVLPNGRVLVTGGSGQPDQLIDVNNDAEIWDPATGQWSVGATGLRPRLYHSFALLLPDASVLVGGGGASDDPPVNNLHAEIYYPPYLYDSSGEFASRPVIDPASAPGTLDPGENFTIVAGPGNIDRVTLIQAGSATHGANLQQRFVELPFTADGNTLSVQMPARATDTPPGYYLLFVIDDQGVPSKAKIVKVNVQEDDPDPEPDTIAPTQPAGLAVTKVQGNPRLVWNASSDNVGVTGYAVHRSTNGTVGPEITRVQGTNWTDTGVQEGTKYTYAVKAFDAAGNLSPASAKKAIIAFQIPTKPTNFSLKLVNNDPQLSFTASTDNVGVAGYNVYRSTNGTTGPLFAQIAGAPWIDTSAQKGVRYSYTVRARDAAGYLSNATQLKSITAK